MKHEKDDIKIKDLIVKIVKEANRKLTLDEIKNSDDKLSDLSDSEVNELLNQLYKIKHKDFRLIPSLINGKICYCFNENFEKDRIQAKEEAKQIEFDEETKEKKRNDFKNLILLLIDSEGPLTLSEIYNKILKLYGINNTIRYYKGTYLTSQLIMALTNSLCQKENSSMIIKYSENNNTYYKSNPNIKLDYKELEKTKNKYLNEEKKEFERELLIKEEQNKKIANLILLIIDRYGPLTFHEIIDRLFELYGTTNGEIKYTEYSNLKKTDCLYILGLFQENTRDIKVSNYKEFGETYYKIDSNTILYYDELEKTENKYLKEKEIMEEKERQSEEDNMKKIWQQGLFEKMEIEYIIDESLLTSQELMENDRIVGVLTRLMREKYKQYLDTFKNRLDNVRVKALVSEMDTKYNNFAHALINTTDEPYKPMSSTSAGMIGGVLGGVAGGILAENRQKDKIEKYKENLSNFNSSNSNKINKRLELIYLYYELEKIILSNDEVKNDWILSRNEEINNSTNKKKQGCYVATCVYGSYDCPQVWTLRRFRDYTLTKTWYGRLFIKVYYAISPSLIRIFGNTKWFKNMLKPRLDRMVKKLQNKGFDSTPYNDKKYDKKN